MEMQNRDDNDLIEQHQINQLLTSGGYRPFFHRLKESIWSNFVKSLGNFIITIIQICNVPFFIIGLITIFEFVIKVWNDNFSLGNFKDHLTLGLYVIATYFVIIQLIDKTKANMSSAEIDLIWAVNFKKGRIPNLFHSIEMEERYTNDLSKLVKRNLMKKISVRENELLETINELEEVLKRIESTSSFPEETLYSFSRMTEIIITPVLKSSNPRHSYEVTMDHILNQIIHLDYFNGRVKQGTIMLKEEENGEEVLKIIGQSDISDTVINSKKIKVGEKFSGKIAQLGQLVFIDDIYSVEATQYGYGPETSKEKTYTAIMGMPIRKQDGESFETIGIINLHFNEDPNYTENERTEIEKTLDVYGHFIVSYLKIRESVKINEQTK